MTTNQNSIITAILTAMLTASALAQTVPSLINYQGRLTDSTGAPLTAGNYGIQFKLWDSSTNTTGLIWGQQQNVAVHANGVFNVMLGGPGGSAIAGVTQAVNELRFAFASPNCFLGATVVSSNGVNLGVANEIATRQEILSVPYAVSALHGVPAGTIVAFWGETVSPPDGWLCCDGPEYPTNQFPRLLQLLMRAWGGSSSTFRVPDLRGVFLRGVNGGRSGSIADPDAGARFNAYAGGNVGTNVGSFQSDGVKSHGHAVNITGTTSNYTHRHVITGDWSSGIGGASNSSDGDACLYNSDGWRDRYHEDTGPTRTPTLSQSQATRIDSGGNETRPMNAYVNYIIKY